MRPKPLRPLRLLALLLSVVGPALSRPAAAGSDPAPPELRLPGGARPVRMTVDLTIRPELETFGGVATIDLRFDAPASFLWLNAERLEIGAASLEVGGVRRAVRLVSGGDQFAGFAFDGEIPAGTATLTVDYRGRLDAIETEGLFRQVDGGDSYVYSQFESTYARRAFPCFDEPAFRTPWRITLHVPRALLAVSNMPQTAEREEPEGMKAVDFAETPSISSYLVALGVGPFEIVGGGVWGRNRTPVRILVPRGRAARAAYAAEVTGDSLARLEEYFGTPHPFSKLDNLGILQTVGFGAMENPGLVTYAERLIAIDPVAPPLERRRAYSSVVTHENAHQWFGNLVTMAWWDDIWLNEGFADWISDKTIASWRPEWWGEADRAVRRSEAVQADSLPSARRVRRPIASLDDVATAFDGISYTKGATLLEMWEAWVGPDRFRAGIRRYLAQHAWGNATSDDFLAALAAEGSPEVARGFASFLDQAGTPVVSFAAECPAGEGARLRVAQRRYVPFGSPLAATQRWVVPIRLRYGAGDRSASTRALLEEAESTVPLDFCPEWVSGNEEGIGYYLSEYRGDLLARLAAHADELPAAEQIALLDDAAFLVASGAVPPGEALGLLPRLANSPHRRVVEAAAEIAASVDDHLVTDATRPAYERFLAQLFGSRARALGLSPLPSESEDDALLRPKLIRLFAEAGADRELRVQAAELAERWFEDRSRIDPDMVGTVLRLAARDGDAALFDRLVAVAAAETDRRIRGDLLAALGGFRDPLLVDRALALLLSGTFDLREAGQILLGLTAERETRERTYEWVKASYDELVPKLPQQFAAYLPLAGAGFCDAERRADVDSFFRPRSAKLPGGEILLGKALEQVEGCAALTAAQRPAVSAFLAAY